MNQEKTAGQRRNMNRLNIGIFLDSQILCEISDCGCIWSIVRLNESNIKAKYVRPMIGIWHFNDGSMVLPDGLVAEIKYSDHQMLRININKGSYFSDFYHTNSRSIYVIAIKIIGVHPDYAEHGKEMGMEIIEA